LETVKLRNHLEKTDPEMRALLKRDLKQLGIKEAACIGLAMGPMGRSLALFLH